ncbi:MAG: thermonuclease family protein [Coriobacteriia bacterium]|nr:thermonuclease family protein [Coriobacteriia bacterium]
MPRASTRNIAIALVAALAIAGGYIADFFGVSLPGLSTPLSTDSSYDGSTLLRGEIDKIVDGDTVYIRFTDGSRRKARLIGIDTPELNQASNSEPSGQKGPEPGAVEAKAFVEHVLSGQQTVWVEYDLEPHDRYGRDLVYVWLSDPSEEVSIESDMLNGLILASGWAEAIRVKPNAKYYDIFRSIEKRAKDAGLGIWGFDR